MTRLFVTVLFGQCLLTAALQFVPLKGRVVRRVDETTGIPVIVHISPFEAGAHEVTQAEFHAIAGLNPSARQGDRLPVENVSWWEAIRYCNLRSIAENLQPCYNLSTGACDLSRNGYRLLTDAEWTYALGKLPPKEDLSKFAWLGSLNTKSARDLMTFARTNGTKAVAMLKPNENGLYDMLGNVWEWVQDYQDPSEAVSSSVNPSGPGAGVARILRGGSWLTTTSQWSAGYRSSLEPDRRSPYTGFRICRTLPDPPPASIDETWFAPYKQAPGSVRNQIGTLAPLTPGLDLAGWNKQCKILFDKWSAVLGAMSCLKSAPAVRRTRTDQEPTFTGELMYLQVEPDYWEKIYVMLPRAADPWKPLPVVIVPFYDVDTPAGKSMGGRRMNPLGTRSYGHRAVQQGMAAIAIRWYGESYGENLTEAVVNLNTRHPQVTGLGKWVWDSQRLLDYIATRPELDSQRIGMMGHSLGGKMTLYATAMDPRIRAAVSSEPGIGLNFSNYDDYWYLGEKVHGLSPGTDQHELLALIAPRPFLLIGGDSADSDKSWYYINAARAVYNLFGFPNYIGYFNHRAGHSPTPEAINLAMEWLTHFLNGRSPRESK